MQSKPSMAEVPPAQKNSLAAPSISRRSLLWTGAAGLAVAGCAQTDAQAVGLGGPYRSLREMAAWNPNTAGRPPAVQEAAWTGEPLLPLRRGLAEQQRGRRRSPVSIAQFGDSHTMSPALVPRLRELFQSRYGALGPGRLAPGNGPRFSRPALVQTEQQGDWQGASAQRTPGAFSLPGYRLRGEAPGSRVVLRSTEEAGFDKFQLELLMQPGGGSFRLMVDGQAGPRLPSAGNATRHVPLVYEPPQRHREVAIELLGDGPVELLGWGMERRGPGVLVEGFGLNGATIDLLYNLDQGMLRDGLAGRNPALVILAFGTNEAVSPRTTREAYASQLTERVRTIRRMAPASGVLIMGAPDAAKRSGGRGQGCSAWEALPALAEVRAAQREVARRENCAFWDWGSITGGICGLHNGTRSNPRLVQDDHIHFTADGYRLTAERLFAYLAGQGVA